MPRVRLLVLLLALCVLFMNALLYRSLGYWAYGRLLGFIPTPTMDDSLRECPRLDPTLYLRYREPRSADARTLVSIHVEGEAEQVETAHPTFRHRHQLDAASRDSWPCA
jgi:hypothetical protein